MTIKTTDCSMEVRSYRFLQVIMTIQSKLPNFKSPCILWETVCSTAYPHLLDVLKIIGIFPTYPEDDRAIEDSTTRKDHTGPTKPNFRLLHLKSGTGNQQLCAAVHIEHIDSAATNGYICLSYVWGTDISTEHIKIDENEISIHASLLTSLRHIRNPHDTLVLWVDALYVDQNDPDEKASQIANLGEIYSRCSLVYRWLGAPPNHIPTTGDPFQWFQHFSDNKQHHEMAGYHKANSVRIRFEENSEFNDLWDRFLLIANSTWFTRVWTVQEAVLSPDHVLCYGNWRSSLDRLISARRSHIGNGYRCMMGPKFGSDHFNLPSWVPDLSATIPLVEIEAVIRRISSFTLYEASGSKFGNFQIQGAELSVSGRWVDTISTIGFLFPTDNVSAEVLKNILMNWKALCEKIGTCREASLRMALSGFICASKIDDRVSLNGRRCGWRQIKTHDLPSMEEWSQFLGGDVWALQEEYRRAVEIASTGRCFYITKTGKIGLCYPHVKTGDQVWVLKNFNSPFVLRKVGSESNNTRVFRFIGDCYLDGTVDEEAVKATKKGSCITLV
ncbi:uncharacterized protein EAF01_002219 [Botrytis porri]|uniref:uncharacterized protein n=1 Tax=Botrytis porri TaxID=87229 RepID=UPI001900D9A8|nr:uncharacterized protein EAF01_002219 [Botrytis porri]KAF7910709.1 hypothetical protein EAF01_002219 [Botrytis porri]